MARDKAPDSSYLGHDLIFIISQPKAGSTLLQRILAGHPDIQTSAETWLMLHPVYGIRKRGIKTDYNANLAATGVREFLDHYADGKETYRDGVRSFARTIYGSVLEKHGKRLFLDKTPRYTMIVDELYALFPQARFVFLLRNPLAILNSELHTYVKGDWQILAEFAPDLVEAPARIVAARALLGDAAQQIRYEDLVTAPETQVRQLCAYLGIDFREDMLDYSNTPAPQGRMNDPVGIHRHTRPSGDSLEKWKAMGSDGQQRHLALEYLDALGKQTVTDLGYDPVELRSTIERQALSATSKHIYPWQLAITGRERRSLRQHTAHAYFMAAQERGWLHGMLQAGKSLLARLGGGAARLAGRASK